jgi:hypothetical protein
MLKCVLLFQIKCLHVYLPKLHTLVSTDVYQLASAIGYLNLAVGNSAIKVAEKVKSIAIIFGVAIIKKVRSVSKF